MRTTRSGPDPARLDPARSLRLPRRGAVWRILLVAVLLLAAAGAWLGPGGADPPVSVPAPADPSPDASPAVATQAPAGSPPAGSPRVGEPPAGPSGTRLPVPDGLVGVPVPLGAPAATAMLRPGDRVDLLVTGATADDEPVLLAEDATVLAVDQPGAALLLALTPTQAHEVVAMAASSARFAVIVRS